MADLVTLPPIVLIEGFAFSQGWIFEAGGDPVDLSLWSGTFEIAATINDAALVTEALTLGADGSIELTIPVADIALLTPSDILGGGPVGVYQITLTAPDTIDDQIWQGVCNVAGRI